MITLIILNLLFEQSLLKCIRHIYDKQIIQQNQHLWMNYQLQSDKAFQIDNLVIFTLQSDRETQILLSYKDYQFQFTSIALNYNQSIKSKPGQYGEIELPVLNQSYIVIHKFEIQNQLKFMFCLDTDYQNQEYIQTIQQSHIIFQQLRNNLDLQNLGIKFWLKQIVYGFQLRFIKLESEHGEIFNFDFGNRYIQLPQNIIYFKQSLILYVWFYFEINLKQVSINKFQSQITVRSFFTETYKQAFQIRYAFNSTLTFRHQNALFTNFQIIQDQQLYIQDLCQPDCVVCENQTQCTQCKQGNILENGICICQSKLQTSDQNGICIFPAQKLELMEQQQLLQNNKCYFGYHFSNLYNECLPCFNKLGYPEIQCIYDVDPKQFIKQHALIRKFQNQIVGSQKIRCPKNCQACQLNKKVLICNQCKNGIINQIKMCKPCNQKYCDICQYQNGKELCLLCQDLYSLNELKQCVYTKKYQMIDIKLILSEKLKKFGRNCDLYDQECIYCRSGFILIDGVCAQKSFKFIDYYSSSNPLAYKPYQYIFKNGTQIKTSQLFEFNLMKNFLEESIKYPIFFSQQSSKVDFTPSYYNRNYTQLSFCSRIENCVNQIQINLNVVEVDNTIYLLFENGSYKNLSSILDIIEEFDIKLDTVIVNVTKVHSTYDFHNFFRAFDIDKKNFNVHLFIQVDNLKINSSETIRLFNIQKLTLMNINIESTLKQMRFIISTDILSFQYIHINATIFFAFINQSYIMISNLTYISQTQIKNDVLIFFQSEHKIQELYIQKSYFEYFQLFNSTFLQLFSQEHKMNMYHCVFSQMSFRKSLYFNSLTSVLNINVKYTFFEKVAFRNKSYGFLWLSQESSTFANNLTFSDISLTKIVVEQSSFIQIDGGYFDQLSFFKVLFKNPTIINSSLVQVHNIMGFELKFQNLIFVNATFYHSEQFLNINGLQNIILKNIVIENIQGVQKQNSFITLIGDNVLIDHYKMVNRNISYKFMMLQHFDIKCKNLEIRDYRVNQSIYIYQDWNLNVQYNVVLDFIKYSDIIFNGNTFINLLIHDGQLDIQDINFYITTKDQNLIDSIQQQIFQLVAITSCQMILNRASIVVDYNQNLHKVKQILSQSGQFRTLINDTQIDIVNKQQNFQMFKLTGLEVAIKNSEFTFIQQSDSQNYMFNFQTQYILIDTLSIFIQDQHMNCIELNQRIQNQQSIEIYNIILETGSILRNFIILDQSDYRQMTVANVTAKNLNLEQSILQLLPIHGFYLKLENLQFSIKSTAQSTAINLIENQMNAVLNNINIKLLSQCGRIIKFHGKFLLMQNIKIQHVSNKGIEIDALEITLDGIQISKSNTMESLLIIRQSSNQNSITLLNILIYKNRVSSNLLILSLSVSKVNMQNLYLFQNRGDNIATINLSQKFDVQFRNFVFINNSCSTCLILNSDIQKNMKIKQLWSINNIADNVYKFSNIKPTFVSVIFNDYLRKENYVYIESDSKLKFVDSYIVWSQGVLASFRNHIEIQDSYITLKDGQEIQSGDDHYLVPEKLQLQINQADRQIRLLEEKEDKVVNYKIDNKHYQIPQFNIYFPSGQQLKNYQILDLKTKQYEEYINYININGIDNSNIKIKLNKCYLNTNINDTNLIQLIPNYISSNQVLLSDVLFIANPYLIEKFVLQVQCIYSNLTLQLNMNIQMFKCQIGEILYQNQCLQCNITNNQYSVNKRSQICKYVNHNIIQHYKVGLLKLKQGYWRPYYSNDQIELCRIQQNCLGGWNVNYESCQIGYFGPLCNECDNQNIRGDGYFSKYRQQCFLCEYNINVLYIIIVIIIQLITLIITTRSQYLNNQRYQQLIYTNKYYKILNKLSIDQISVVFKQIQNYFFYIQFIDLTFEIDLNLGLYTNFVSNPIQLLNPYYDCISQYYNYNIIIKLLIQIVTPLFIILLFYFIILIINRFYKFRQLFVFIYVPLLYFFVVYQIIIFQNSITLITYVTISGIKWINGARQYQYYESSNINLFIFSSFILFIFTIIIPFGLMYILKKKRTQLYNKTLLMKLGYLYQEYKNQIYFWEFYKMAFKILFVGLNILLINDTKLVVIFSILIILSKIEIGKLVSPFYLKNLNMDDYKFHAILILTLFLTELYRFSQFYIKVIALVFIYLVNFIHFIDIIRKILLQVINNNIEFFDKIRQKIYKNAEPQMEKRQLAIQRFKLLRLFYKGQYKNIIKPQTLSCGLREKEITQSKNGIRTNVTVQNNQMIFKIFMIILLSFLAITIQQCTKEINTNIRQIDDKQVSIWNTYQIMNSSDILKNQDFITINRINDTNYDVYYNYSNRSFIFFSTEIGFNQKIELLPGEYFNLKFPCDGCEIIIKPQPKIIQILTCLDQYYSEVNYIKYQPNFNFLSESVFHNSNFSISLWIKEINKDDGVNELQFLKLQEWQFKINFRTQNFLYSDGQKVIYLKQQLQFNMWYYFQYQSNQVGNQNQVNKLLIKSQSIQRSQYETANAQFFFQNRILLYYKNIIFTQFSINYSQYLQENLCQPDCLECQDQQCKTCKNNLELKGNICVCPFRDQFTDQHGNCKYQLNLLELKEQISILKNSNCQFGYYKKEGDCVLCPYLDGLLDINCLITKTTTQQKQQLSNFQQNFYCALKQIQSINVKFKCPLGCESCDLLKKVIICYYCSEGTYIHNNLCSQCQVQNCDTCEDSSKCSICKESYSLDQNQQCVYTNELKYEQLSNYLQLQFQQDLSNCQYNLGQICFVCRQGFQLQKELCQQYQNFVQLYDPQSIYSKVNFGYVKYLQTALFQSELIDLYKMYFETSLKNQIIIQAQEIFPLYQSTNLTTYSYCTKNKNCINFLMFNFTLIQYQGNFKLFYQSNDVERLFDNLDKAISIMNLQDSISYIYINISSDTSLIPANVLGSMLNLSQYNYEGDIYLELNNFNIQSDRIIAIKIDSFYQVIFNNCQFIAQINIVIVINSNLVYMNNTYINGNVQFDLNARNITIDKMTAENLSFVNLMMFKVNNQDITSMQVFNLQINKCYLFNSALFYLNSTSTLQIQNIRIKDLFLIQSQLVIIDQEKQFNYFILIYDLTIIDLNLQASQLILLPPKYYASIYKNKQVRMTNISIDTVQLLEQTSFLITSLDEIKLIHFKNITINYLFIDKLAYLIFINNVYYFRMESTLYQNVELKDCQHGLIYVQAIESIAMNETYIKQIKGQSSGTSLIKFESDIVFIYKFSITNNNYLHLYKIINVFTNTTSISNYQLIHISRGKGYFQIEHDLDILAKFSVKIEHVLYDNIDLIGNQSIKIEFLKYLGRLRIYQLKSQNMLMQSKNQFEEKQTFIQILSIGSVNISQMDLYIQINQTKSNIACHIIEQIGEFNSIINNSQFTIRNTGINSLNQVLQLQGPKTTITGLKFYYYSQSNQKVSLIWLNTQQLYFQNAKFEIIDQNCQVLKVFHKKGKRIVLENLQITQSVINNFLEVLDSLYGIINISNIYLNANVLGQFINIFSKQTDTQIRISQIQFRQLGVSSINGIKIFGDPSAKLYLQNLLFKKNEQSSSTLYVIQFSGNQIFIQRAAFLQLYQNILKLNASYIVIQHMQICRVQNNFETVIIKSNQLIIQGLKLIDNKQFNSFLFKIKAFQFRFHDVLIKNNSIGDGQLQILEQININNKTYTLPIVIDGLTSHENICKQQCYLISTNELNNIKIQIKNSFFLRDDAKVQYQISGANMQFMDVITIKTSISEDYTFIVSDQIVSINRSEILISYGLITNNNQNIKLEKTYEIMKYEEYLDDQQLVPKRLQLQINQADRQIRLLQEKEDNIVNYKIDNNHYDIPQFNIYFPSGQQLKNYQILDLQTKQYEEYINYININGIDNSNIKIKLNKCYLNTNINDTNLIQLIPNYISSNQVLLSDVLFIANPYLIEKFVLQVQCIYSNLTLQLNMNIQMFKCQIGEILYQNQCLQCNITNNQYSVNKRSQICKYVNHNIIQDYKVGLLKLKQGYWRPYYSNDQIELCKIQQNCLGGWNVNYESCQIGYFGPLCNECDNQNIRGDGYFSKYRQQCFLCEYNLNLFYIIIVIIIQLITLIITTRSQYLNNQRYQQLIYTNKYYKILNKLSIDQISVVFKQIQNYFFYIQFIDLTFEIDLNLGLYTNLVSNPIQVLNPYYDCMSQYYNYNIIIKLLIQIVTPLFIILLFYFIILIINRFYKFRQLFVFIYVPLLYFFVVYQIIIFQNSITLITYVTISGIKWINGARQYQYYESSNINLFIFSSFILFIFTIIIPFCLLYILRKKRTQLYNKTLLMKLGYLYQEYKNQIYFWEFYKMAFKIVFITISYQLINQKEQSILIVSIFIFIISQFNRNLQPFNLRILNNFDMKLHTQFLVTLICIYLLVSQLFIKQVVIIFIYLSNSLLAFDILKFFLIKFFQTNPILVDTIIIKTLRIGLKSQVQKKQNIQQMFHKMKKYIKSRGQRSVESIYTNRPYSIQISSIQSVQTEKNQEIELMRIK